MGQFQKYLHTCNDKNLHYTTVSQTILVNVAQVPDENEEEFYREMIDEWVTKAAVVLSLGSKLYEFYEDVYR